MGLTNKKEEQLKRMPAIESRFQKSKDGRFLIHRTTITTIRPIAYFEKVIQSEGTIPAEELQKALADEDLLVNGEDLLNQ
jgi:hypothetical protein